MTTEQAHKWAKINADKKFTFDGDYAVKAQEVVVVGSDVRPGPGMVTVQLSDASGWKLDGPCDSIAWTAAATRDHSKTYRHVQVSELTPIMVMTAEQFAKAYAGEICTFMNSDRVVRGTVVGYNAHHVLIERDDGRGWRLDPWIKRELVVPTMKTTTCYWWMLVDEADLNSVKKPATEAPRRLACAEEASTPAAAFKPGDVVYLKSGGPAMTVDTPADEGGDYLCRWFPYDHWNGETSEDFFSAATLTKTPTRVGE